MLGEAVVVAERVAGRALNCMADRACVTLIVEGRC